MQRIVRAAQTCKSVFAHLKKHVHGGRMQKLFNFLTKARVRRANQPPEGSRHKRDADCQTGVRPQIPLFSPSKYVPDNLAGSIEIPSDLRNTRDEGPGNEDWAISEFMQVRWCVTYAARVHTKRQGRR